MNAHLDTQPLEKDSHFGDHPVSAADKTRMVARVFESVAGRYDLMNDLMSGGMHRLWKNAMVDVLALRPGMKMLDVAGGTGDIAFRVFERLEHMDAPPAREQITICDINAAMLGVGRARAAAKYGARADVLNWINGNAENLPLPDRSFDAYTIAFGIRNVTHMDRALREARRVLRPGGLFLCLEFSSVDVPGLDRLYDIYSQTVVPQLGEWVTGDGEAYRYLVESIRRFPDREVFKTMIENAGFSQIRIRSFSGGIVTLHSAWRI